VADLILVAGLGPLWELSSPSEAAMAAAQTPSNPISPQLSVHQKPENPPQRVSSQLKSHQLTAGESNPRRSITVNTSATSWTMIRAVLATVLMSCSA